MIQGQQPQEGVRPFQGRGLALREPVGHQPGGRGQGGLEGGDGACVGSDPGRVAGEEGRS